MRKALILTLLLVSAACSQRRPLQAEWTQGYETQGGYMQPDHGWLYYWWMASVLNQTVRPTYHIYSAPAGYPASYRPWHSRPGSGFSTTTLEPSKPSSSSTFRSSGGFSTAPRTTPSKPASSSFRSSGGFSRPSTSGGSFRSSGGFSSGSRSTSSGGGFRSSGGFGKR